MREAHMNAFPPRHLCHLFSLSRTGPTPASLNKQRMGAGNRRALSGAYVSVTMIYSAGLGGLQAPKNKKQKRKEKKKKIRADRPVEVKQDPSPKLNSEHNVLLHTAGSQTHGRTHTRS